MTKALPSHTIERSSSRVWAKAESFGRAIRPGLGDLAVHGIGQVRIFSKPYAGVMHALIFWGMTIQIIGTIIGLLQIPLFVPFIELDFPRSYAYLAYELLMDLAGAAILIGGLMALIRRHIRRPKALDNKWDDYYAIALILVIPTVGFLLEAMRFLAIPHDWAHWSPIGNLLATALGAIGISPVTAWDLHYPLYWLHIISGLVFVASIPFTKLRHLVTGPLHILTRPQGRGNAITPIENIEETELLGVGHVSEFSPIQLLSFDACVRCGRCEEVCPASLSGMAFSPKKFLLTLRTEMISTFQSQNGNPFDISPEHKWPSDTAWDCTTCGACVHNCPMFINPVTDIIDIRRYQVLTTGEIPKSVADVLRNMERQGNPWGLPPQDRTVWTHGLNVRVLAPGDSTDVLLYLGCAYAFDTRNKDIARTFVNLLEASGIDFAILGLDEMCCGETARRLGHEYLFQVSVEQNIETFQQVNFKRIVTQCPHCFNTLKNEYPQFGGTFDVQHYTEFLAELGPEFLTGIREEENSKSGPITFHDSCYLGRYNQIFDAPRTLLDQAAVDRVEMKACLGNGFCCGGGGGQMWMETDAEVRINHRRLEQAIEVGAKTIATACPYCLLMFDDAIRSRGVGEEIQVLDIAEVLGRQQNTNGNKNS